MRTCAVPYTPLIHPPAGIAPQKVMCRHPMSGDCLYPVLSARIQATPGCWGGCSLRPQQSLRCQEGIFLVSGQVFTASLFSLLGILVLFILDLKLTRFSPCQSLGNCLVSVADGCLHFQPTGFWANVLLPFRYSVQTHCTRISILAAEVVQTFLPRGGYVDFPMIWSWSLGYNVHS